MPSTCRCAALNAARSLLLTRRAAPSGNTRLSPLLGLLPPQLLQFAALLQLLSAPLPVHVHVAAFAACAPNNASNPATTVSDFMRHPRIRAHRNGSFAAPFGPVRLCGIS